MNYTNTSSNDQYVRASFDIVLFEQCNLKCDHCYQNHKSTFDPTVFDQIARSIDIHLDHVLARNGHIDVATFGISGGELFIDCYPNSQLDHYRRLVEMINRITKSRSIKSSIEFISNGLFNNRGRVLDLLNDTKSVISISYDPVGRFKTATQRDVVLSTIDYFKKRSKIGEISITLSKPAIDHYIANDDLAMFSYVPIGICYYLNVDDDNLVATQDDLYRFWKYVNGHRYTNVMAYTQIIDSIINHRNVGRFCNCSNRLIIRCGDRRVITTDCSGYFASGSTNWFDKVEDGYTEIKIHNRQQIIGESIVHCNTCKYKHRCPSMCFKSAAMTNCGQCSIKRLIEDIKNDRKTDSNHSILSQAQ